MTCPHCGEAARCVGDRGKGVTSLLRWVQRERHCDHCGSRGQGRYPWDQTLGTADHRLTAGAREVVSLTGIQEKLSAMRRIERCTS